MQDRLEIQNRRCLMSMNYINLFSYYYLSDYAHYHEHTEERVLTNKRNEWEVVNFHAVANVPYSYSLLIVHVGHNHYFMSSFY